MNLAEANELVESFNIPVELKMNLKKANKLVAGVTEKPNILMGAMELGKVPGLFNTKGDDVQIKIGGMAVVVEDMFQEFPTMLDLSNGKLQIATMAYGGIDLTKLKKEASVFVTVKNKEYEVKVYKHTFKTRKLHKVSLYLLGHPIFNHRSVLTPKDAARNIYASLNPDENFFRDRPDWEDAYTFSIFNQALAALGERLKINIYHSHDFHTSMAPLYFSEGFNPVSVNTIHNGGAGYQGQFWTENDTDTLLSIFNITFEQYMQYFEIKGDFNMLQGATNFNHNHFLVGGIPVSNGYAKELLLSRAELIQMITDQKNGVPPKDPNQINTFNGDITFRGLSPVTNGMGSIAHACSTPNLKADGDSKIDSLIKSPEVRKALLEGLNFGEDLETEEGIEDTLLKKQKLKDLLQLEAFGKIEPKAPILGLVARFVTQKRLDILLRLLPSLLENGVKVVILGSPGDEVGKQDASKLKSLALNSDYAGKIKFYEEFSLQMATLIVAGADFSVFTPLHEPCGLTDLEAAWLATIVISKKIGGLGKVDAGFYYSYYDTSDPEGEVEILAGLVNEFLDLYKNNPAEIQRRRISGMKQLFPWSGENGALRQYMRNYRVAAYYAWLKIVMDALSNGQISEDPAVKLADRYTRKIAPDDRDLMRELLIQKQRIDPLHPLEEHILNIS